jgi:seryl-tRNA synthetase
MVDKALQRERDGLLTELARLDARREQLKAEIVRENRMPGVSKLQIALKQTERAELLHTREELRRKISAVNDRIKETRQQQHQAPVASESVAQRFMAIARRSLPREMFQDLLDVAQEERQPQ